MNGWAWGALAATVAAVGGGLISGSAVSAGNSSGRSTESGLTPPDTPGVMPRRDARASKVSRRAFSGQGAAAAAALARARFRISQPVWVRPEVRDASDFVRFVSDFAQIQRRGSHWFLVGSTTPLAVRDEQGHRQKTSLTVRHSADGWAPVRPAVPVTLADEPSAAISLPDGITVRPASSGAHSPILVGNRLFYGSSATDTDFMAEPIPGGVETFWQMRSELSPSRHDLVIDLPAGLSLRPSPVLSGQLEVVDENGNARLVIRPPAATDAAGFRVPVRARVAAAERVSFTVDLPDDVEFPVLVDPIMEANYGTLSQPNQWAHWDSAASPTDQKGRFQLVKEAGLLTEAIDPAQQGYYTANIASKWFVDRHGDALLNRVDVGGVEHQQLNKSGFLAGMFTGTGGTFDGSYTGSYTDNGYAGNQGSGYFWTTSNFGPSNPFAFCAQAGPPGGSDSAGAPPLCDQSAGSNSFAAVLWVLQNGLDITNYVRFRYASVKYVDAVNPGAPSFGGVDGSWRQTLDNLTVSGSDGGVGVYSFVLDGAGPSQYKDLSGCNTAAQGWFCPSSYTMGFPTSAPPEGKYSISATVRDLVQNLSSGSTPVAIDRTGPAISLSGPLWTGRDRSDDRRRMGIYTVAPTLTIDTTDGNTSSPAAERSGSKSINVTVRNSQGAVVQSSPDPAPQGCASSCTKNRTFTLATAGLADGAYSITVDAYDQLSNSTSQTFSVTLDLSGTIVHGRIGSGDPAAGGVVDRQEWADLGPSISRDANSVRVAEPDGVSAQTASSSCHGATGISSCLRVTQLFDGDYFEVEGTSASDSRLPRISEFLRSSGRDYPLVATDTPEAALAPWQQRPPGSADSYERHVLTVAGVTQTVWIDSATKLPVRYRTQYLDGTEDNGYVAFDLGRVRSDELPPDYFTVSAPPSASSRKSQTLFGSAAVGVLSDPDTGSSFVSYYLGDAASLVGKSYCLLTSDTISASFDASDAGTSFGGESADPAGPSLVGNAYYKNGTCSLGVGAGAPSASNLLVASTASTSRTSQAWRKYFVAAAQEIQSDVTDSRYPRGGVVTVTAGGQLTSAYVVPLDAARLGFLVQIGTVTVQVLGDFAKTDVSNIASLLRAH
jgi:hypothetical protein